MKLSGQRNECPTCGQLFNSNHAFDKHRTGSYTPNKRRCLTPDEMMWIDMFKGDDGFWRGSVMPQREWA